MRSFRLWVLILAALPAKAAVLHIRIYDLAGLPSPELERSTQIAQRVFLAMGIRTTWTEGDRDDPQARSVDNWGAMNCSADVPFDQLRIRLIRGTADVPATVLGVAHPCSNHGAQVTIYADHVEALSRKSSNLTASVLAHAMLHEIGHALLRTGAHSLRGVMKAKWNTADWQAAISGRLSFEPDEAARMFRSICYANSQVAPGE